MTLRLPSALVNWFRGVPSPIDAIQPTVDDLKELRRYTGVSEIMRASRDNVLEFQSRGTAKGYAWTFTKEK